MRAALGEGADLIAEHASVAVYMTEMFSILLKDASATRYDNTHVRNIHHPEYPLSGSL
ncbi:hypothetical protein IWX64_003395 [Arthrobacter sp. CAN_A212]